MAFGPDDLIACYAEGIFPMADSRDDPGVRLIDPELRGVIPLAGAHIPRRLARTVRSDRFEVRIDTAFSAVVRACAAPAADREETWISRGIEYLYGELFARAQAHSVECWRDDRLVGGLYGVALGGAFFGESMFSLEPDASKVALTHLMARLIVGDFALLDIQFVTDHLRQFGALEIPRRDYRRRLAAALPIEADFYRLEPRASGPTALAVLSPRR
jgi:leucyl/phenylalanyl-tRNA--protein transferase